MVNIWNQYQCTSLFASHVLPHSLNRVSGAAWVSVIQTRTSQDLYTRFLERARERIIDIASTQFPDGGCYHQYQPLNKRGNNDIGGGWLTMIPSGLSGTVSYIKETGDFGILNESVPFDNDASVARSLSTISQYPSTMSRK